MTLVRQLNTKEGKRGVVQTSDDYIPALPSNNNNITDKLLDLESVQSDK